MSFRDTLTRRASRIDRLFLIVVVVPTLLSIIYFGLMASDVYVSESRFVVRSPDKPAASSFGVLLKGVGVSTAGDEVFAAQQFVLSRDALRALDKDGSFRKAYSAGSISVFDRLNPFGFSKSFEGMFSYYTGKVHAEHDATSSITTLSVRAFRPEDAARFNRQLLDMAEATVNRLNDRARQDLIQTAFKEVEDAKERARVAALGLSAFRNREGVLDPEKQAAVQIQMISKLQDELIAARTQLQQLRTIAPDNSQIEVLQAQIRGLEAAIKEQLGAVAGGSRSLSSTAARYQRLALESQFADKQLAAAMASLQDAENEALRKHAYVERIVQPNLPDYPIEPRRWRGILSTLMFSFIAWAVLSMLFAGIKEHAQ